ncbi:MAG: hypothetical protein IJI58_03510 [Bacilli bacterium]|nr:hypothetical protein [Bacilli bacterium]
MSDSEEKIVLSEDDNQKTTKKKLDKNTVIIIALIVIAVVMSALFILEKKSNNHNKLILSGKIKQEEKLLRNAEKSALYEYGLSLEKENMEHYIRTESYLTMSELQSNVKTTSRIVCEENEAYTDGTVYLNKCKINGKLTSITYGTKKENIVTKSEVKVEGDTVLVYESIEDSNYSYFSFDKPTDTENMKIHRFKIAINPNDSPSIINNKYLYYMDKNYIMQLIDIKEEKNAVQEDGVEGIYLYKNSGYIPTGYAAVYKNKLYYLYDMTNKKYISNVGYDNLAPFIQYCGTTGPHTSIETLRNYNVAAVKNKKYGVIDISTGKEIIPIKYNRLIIQNELLIALEDNRGHLFSLEGKEFLSNNKIESVYAAINNSYAIIKENKHIKLVLINGDELYDFGEYNVNHLHITGSNVDKIKVEISEDQKSARCVEFSYDLITKKGSAEKKECGGISKPILYLYPEKDTNMDITFDDPGVLETTYPKYNNGWNIFVKPDGSIYDKKGKYYYALYWDEKKIHTVDFSEGFYVTSNNAIDFLEEKLSYIGLNNRERNEFIMYWLPILEKNKKSLVYFELTDERNSYSKINLNPKPDSLLRIVIHIKKVNKKTQIKEEKLTAFDRKGFTAVEWGGTTY